MLRNASAISRSGVIMELYPRSFMSGKGRAHGDLQGITQKLDYLAWLGIQQIWLPPIYPSPMQDGGYDVANYGNIHPMYGTLGDFDELVAAAEEVGIGVIMDLVVNHTSSEHEWFLEALSSPHSPMRDRYIFKQVTTNGQLPNNHRSVFGGSAWEPVPGEPGTFFYHTFASGQPDLDYGHPAVLKEMQDIMRFWFGRGARGIRVDAVYYIGKDRNLPDEPPNPGWDGQNPYDSLLHTKTQFQPGMYELLPEITRIASEFPDRFVLFEAYPNDHSDHTSYHRMYEAVDRSLAAPFHFGLVFARWSGETVKRHVESFLTGLPQGSVPVWNLSNHDQHRVASRIGAEQARVAMALINTLPGSPVLYYGDEIGMVDGNAPVDGEGDDPQAKPFSRDVARTPMQWSSDPSAGFTSAEVSPWIRPSADYRTKNVAAQIKEPDSMLQFTRKLIELRNSLIALAHGRYEPRFSANGEVYSFGRVHEDQELTVLLNFSDHAQTAMVPGATKRPVMGSRDSDLVAGPTIRLVPNEVCILRS